MVREFLLFTERYMTLYVLLNAQGFPEHLDDFEQKHLHYLVRFILVKVIRCTTFQYHPSSYIKSLDIKT